jgi:hypothetical protein
MSTLGKVNDATAFVLFGLGSGNEEVVDGEKKKKLFCSCIWEK